MAKARHGLNEKEARSFVGMLTTSPQKLNLVAQMIRKMPVSKALDTLTFCTKRSAPEVKKALLSAIANATNNHKLDADKLVVKESYVGKAMVLKRFRPRSKGRAFKILKPFSNLTVVVAEKTVELKADSAKVAKKETTKKAAKPAKKEA